MSSNNDIIEFSHIEIRITRNHEWLEEREKRGFYLSESFPIANFELPSRFYDMTEKDLDDFKKWFIPKFWRYFDLRKLEDE